MVEICSGLMHLGLRVKDYHKSLAFYRDILGFKIMFEFTMKDFHEMVGEPVKPGDESRLWLAYLRIRSGQFLEIFPVPDEEVLPYDGRQSFFHFSLQVPDISKTVKEIQARGIKVFAMHKDIAGNKPVPPDFTLLRGKCGSLIAWIHDPDGNLIELMELTDRSYQKKYDR